MKVVVLEADSIGKDMNWDFLDKYGDATVYGCVVQSELKEVIRDADIILSNKLIIDENVLRGSKVKYVCEAATGYNNIDIDYCRKNGIRVTNVGGYSTDSVAQHTIALLLAVYEKLSYYNEYVKSGEYSTRNVFGHVDNYFHEVCGKTWGIVGLGAIGRKTAELAEAFGAKVVYYSASGKKYDVKYPAVDFETLLQESDIISVHCPLTPKTTKMFDKKAFTMMKNDAVLINVARGPIVDERALVDAIKADEIMAAGLDVFEREPIAKDCPLFEIKDNNRLLLTPHMGWGAVEARTRLLNELDKNIEAYLAGNERNAIC